MPPLGILTLASVLKEKGHQVSVIDFAGIPVRKVDLFNKENTDKLSKADWIGITATTPQYKEAKFIKDLLKSNIDKYSHWSLRIPVVIGGMHITSEVYANNMDFLNDGFDSYCTGEGYNSVLKICEDLKDKYYLDKLYSQPIWPDVNTLPFADRDLIDIKNYKYRLGDHKATTIYTSYGCFYSCDYCESRMAGSYTVRNMTPERIKNEIKYINDKWGFTGFMDFSDELNLNRDRFMGICKIYRELKDFVWRGFLVAAKWDSEMAEEAKKSNCYQIASGIESFSPTILKNIHKPATPEINKKFIITTKKAGLNLKVFMIVGLPGETWQTIRETDMALEELKNNGYLPDDLDVSVLQVYHGSNIYKNRDTLDIEFEDYSTNSEKMYYKSSPDSYTDLIQVRTKGMTKYDLIAARNYLEYKYKKSNWLEDVTGRKDLDRIMYNENVLESIKHAEKKIKMLD